MSASVLIPAKNEALSLARLLPFFPVLSKRVEQIVIVVDQASDETLLLKDNIHLEGITIDFVVSGQPGIASALLKGVSQCSGEYIIICMADELIPLLKIDSFFDSLDNGAQFVSATRYKSGGRRYGGSKIGHLFSWTANKLIHKILRYDLSDSTTGMKAFRKTDWWALSSNISYGGWAPALAITKNAHRSGMALAEVPITSIDRLMGGTSSFRLGNWIKEYISAFLN
jgi:dolichol-phosphate mannosyltransferase